MTESNNPKIDVDNLMQKIREEVNKHKFKHLKSTTLNEFSISKSTFNINYIEALLKNAQSRANSRTKWPDKLNRFPFNLNPKLQKIILTIINFLFKDQREVNFNLISCLQESVTLNQQLIEQIETLRVQMEDRLGVSDSRVQSLEDRLGVSDSRVQSLEDRLGVTDSRVQSLENRLGVIDSRVQSLEEQLKIIDKNIQSMDNSFNSFDTLVSSWLTDTKESFDAGNSRIEKIDERLKSVDNHIQDVNNRLSAIDERYARNDIYLKNDLIQQKRLISLFLEEAQRRLPEPFNQEQLQTLISEDQHLLDTFYVAFEDQFRGSREEIKNRLITHISSVEKAITSTGNAPIVDIGCGRGEWIDLLSKQGFKASGIDINVAMVQECQNLGLDAVLGDGLEYLRSLPDNSLAAVSSFHVIEHLQLQKLISLIDEVLRVLRSGGVVILETPNPENLIVGACNFYLDPTHRNPIPPPTAKFILESRGFAQVEIRRLHPMTENHNLENPFLNSLLLGCQDYAVIGWKA
ncbi:MAG: methyltransferase domain-containing protein [Nostoc sp.]|uniref:class I SAM-dependent methyltransferase n=1 Tax=Nostoc sp. TaxID=1180 RepID=UPI002FFD2A8C